MTFWKDARPARPWFRRPRPRHRSSDPYRSRRPRGTGWRPGPRALALALVTAAIVVAGGIVLVRADSSAKGAEAVRTERDASPRVIPARWSRTLPDAPASMLPDHDQVVVIGSDWVSAIGSRDGTVRWQTRVEQVNPQGALRDDTVLLSNRMGFMALERRTGASRWRVETPETPGAVALVGPGGPAAVAIVSTEQGALAGLDSRTGEARWKARYSGRIEGAPAVDHGSGTVAAVWRDAAGVRLRVVDAGTGAIRWEHPLALMAGSPIITDGPRDDRLVVVGAGTGDFDGEVRAFDLADGSPRWRAAVPASFQPGLQLLADRNALYVVDQLADVTRLDLVTGARRWSTDTGGAAVIARPVQTGTAIVVPNLAGEVLTLDRASGALRARRPTAGYPIDLVVEHDLVLIAKRLVDERQVQAFRAARIAGSARNPG